MTNTRGSNATKGVLRGSAKIVQDLIQLVDIANHGVSRMRRSPRRLFHDTYSLPLKIGLPAKSSARMHPTDQTSIAGP